MCFSIKFMLICFLIHCGVVHSELLIVKKIDFGYEALSEAESIQYNDKIVEILQKYQWPMCIGSDLTEDEKNELLSADAPYAEELFIQKKLQQAMPELYLQVIFIPTSLYELFCVIQLFDDNGFFGQKIRNIFDDEIDQIRIDFFDLLKIENISARDVRFRIQQAFKYVNNIFFEKQIFAKPRFERFKFFGFKQYAAPSAVLLVNNKLFNFVNDKFSELNSCENGQKISKLIQQNSAKILNFLLQEVALINLDNFDNEKKTYIQLVPSLLKFEAKNSSNKIIENVVRLEYEAREQNKAMLIRGSNIESMEVSISKKPVKKMLIGSTLYKEYGSVPDIEHTSDNSSNAISDSENSSTDPEIHFWKQYKEKSNSPYSISFGVSLFAGLFNDPFACAYTYLSGYEDGDISLHDNSFAVPVGYAIFINKKDYVQHQNNNLFYIPSLATLPSLFEYGQWFHARAKAAKFMKNGEVAVIGAHVDKVKDPTGVLLITRDPLKHAELFSNFLVQNGRLIQPGDASLLTDAEKSFADDVMKAQTEVANLYKAIRTVTPKIEKATKKFKETRDKKFATWMQDFENL